MDDEPPPGYVAFVAQHLEPLRRDAAGVVGDERDADLLYPDVLSDVAARWRWLELLRTRLGRPGAAETYLGRAFARRSQVWRAERDPGPQIEVWPGEPPPRESSDPPEPQRLPVAPAGSFRSPAPPADPALDRSLWVGPARPTWSSAAVRLAPLLRTGARPDAQPVAEAAIAWWHAYRTHRRHRFVATAVAIFVLVVVFVNLATPYD